MLNVVFNGKKHFWPPVVNSKDTVSNSRLKVSSKLVSSFENTETFSNFGYVGQTCYLTSEKLI